jgi:hypothetical protein
MDQTTSAQTPKQQVVEAIKNGTNMLVTVSRDPSVDQLSACIGLTLMLNKLNKHATAVYSGVTPSTLQFLQPEKTIETNTDSLRDFIISLDRSKADKLRYKVEDDVVKIFITPYRTSLSGDDLRFSQGDFNVDVVLALGVDQRDHLDEAIMGHGRILHDAKVLGISFGQVPSEVGSVNWHEPTASSLSEMLVSISESFQSGILDAQMSTAFLTGIVAETDRFKNDKTTPKVMTMSAQLMAAGANQQLIANELALPEKEPEPEPQPEPEAPEQPAPPSEPEVEQPHVPIAEREVVEEEHTDVPQESSTEDPLPPSPANEESSVIPSMPDVPSEQQEQTPPDVELPEVVEQPKVPEEQSLQDQASDDNEQSVSLHPESFEAPHDEIHIDEAGRFTDEETRKSRQKVIEPLTMGQPAGPKTNLSDYVFEDPAKVAAPVAEAPPEEPANPLMESVAQQQGDPSSPLFSDQAGSDNATAQTDYNVAPDVEDVVGLPEPITAPAEPEVKLPEAPTLDQLKMDEDAARNAVLSAVNSSPDPGPQSPIAALNAAPMPLDQPLIDPSTGVPPPPAVPPPMVQDPTRIDLPPPSQV